MKSISEREEFVLKLLSDTAYNAMEICRCFNDIGARNFLGCYFTFDVNRRGARCRYKERGCKVPSNSVDGLLRRMQKKGLVHSILLRWFDGRSKGAAQNSLQLDLFRFYYVSKKGLANRLMADIQKHLLELRS